MDKIIEELECDPLYPLHEGGREKKEEGSEGRGSIQGFLITRTHRGGGVMPGELDLHRKWKLIDHI